MQGREHRAWIDFSALRWKNLTGKKWRVALPFTIHTVTDKIVKSIKRPSEMFLSIFQGLCKND